MNMPIDPKKETVCKHGQLYRCSKCQFGMIQPRPEPEEIPEFYDLPKYYTHGQSHLAEEVKPTLSDRVRVHLAWRMDRGESLSAERITQILGDRFSEICDIGCGDGALAAKLSDLGHKVHGVEVDMRAAEEARKRGVELHSGTDESLPEAVTSRQFDAVILSHVLEHVLRPVEAIRAIHDILRPGGVLICVVPNNASAGLRWAGAAWEPLDVPRHLNFFVPENLRTIAEMAGLQFRRYLFSEYCRQFRNEWIGTEARIFDAISRHDGRPNPNLRRNSRLRGWGLLARTAFASKSSRYDSVGIIAQKP
jgi:2-polyprenyl-3-methyl-5-hydroxy-6-metoxy-1,4-benzoquinol methylase